MVNLADNCTVFAHPLENILNGVCILYVYMLYCILTTRKDSNENLRHCLGSKAVGDEYGALSSLCFNRDRTRLLCGYAKGQVLHSFLLTASTFRLLNSDKSKGQHHSFFFAKTGFY